VVYFAVKWRDETVDNKSAVTYREIFDLKFRRGYSTSELIERYPKEADKVREIALLQIPTSLLKKVVPQTEVLQRILSLKKRFFGLFG